MKKVQASAQTLSLESFVQIVPRSALNCSVYIFRESDQQWTHSQNNNECCQLRSLSYSILFYSSKELQELLRTRWFEIRLFALAIKFQWISCWTVRLLAEMKYRARFVSHANHYWLIQYLLRFQHKKNIPMDEIKAKNEEMFRFVRARITNSIWQRFCLFINSRMHRVASERTIRFLMFRCHCTHFAWEIRIG